MARRFLKDTDGVHDNSIFMQIHFRGLGGFGRGGSESFIQSGIPATSIHSSKQLSKYLVIAIKRYIIMPKYGVFYVPFSSN